MSFKDMVQQDRGIFLNIDEFGEVHRVEGQNITVVIDDNTLRERQGGAEVGVAEVGVAESSLLLFAYVEDLPPRREAGESINVDGREYIVDDWSEDMGIAQVALGQNRTG